MLEIIEAGGWVMLPIIACSIVATAIVLERSWALRRRRIMPDNLVSTIWQLHRTNKLTEQKIQEIRDGSPLGRMLAAGVVNRYHSREIMKDVIGDVGPSGGVGAGALSQYPGYHRLGQPAAGPAGDSARHHRHLRVISGAGIGNAGLLAGGIAKALITTAAGLMVAIPALLFHRFFNSKVNKLAIAMEEQALRLVEVMKGEREDAVEDA